MTSIWDTEELARHLCGLSDDDESTDIDDAMMEKFDIDFCQFAAVAGALLPLCVMHRSELTGKVYQGFGEDGRMLMQREIESQ